MTGALQALNSQCLVARAAEALADYEATLAINPKAGVKKRAEQLRKEIGG